MGRSRIETGDWQDDHEELIRIGERVLGEEIPREAPSLPRRLVAEAIGTAFLLMAIVGAGIMADNLSDGNVGVALLATSTAIGMTLYVLIVCLAPVSGAHFNPAVTVSVAWRGGFPWREVAPYISVQVLSGVGGVLLVQFMFDEPIIETAGNVREGAGQYLGEFIATFGLLGFIWAAIRRAPGAVAPVVACYIAAAVWFTSSTAFANPAVTIARCFSDTFCGIRPVDAPAFIALQFLGGLAGTAVFTWMAPEEKSAP